ncbi:MAG TPA: AI-2E family transporter [Candidatus Limnocylindria bacterium]|nr:AI-2E family transporter [Candidatus Limnocylindria bacterium]
MAEQDPTPYDQHHLFHSQRSLLIGAGAVLLTVWLMWQLRDLVILVSFAVLLAYALDPLVSALERIPFPRGDRLPRNGASAIIILLLVLIGVWVLSQTLPRLLAELTDFVRGLPANLERIRVDLRQYAVRQGLTGLIGNNLDKAQVNSAQMAQYLGGIVITWAGRLFTSGVQVFGIAVLPLLAFYLLAEREDVMISLLGFVPESARPRLLAVRGAVNRALQSYVRGQAIVCVISGAATGFALWTLGFPVVLLLGVLVAIAEAVPFIGFAVAAIAIGVAGIGLGVGKALLGIAAYAVVNNVIGILVTPRVMGRHLKLHPFVVTISILAGAQLLGPGGAVLALPAAAVIQSLIAEFAPPGVAEARAARRRAAPKGRAAKN